MTEWRLLPYQSCSAFENMAVDEALFRENQRIGGIPTLRFFGWNPAAVSVGFFQDMEADIDLEACRQLGADIVRRITGGRAVFHEAEVTYSLVGREEDPLFPPGILGRYQSISEALSLALSSLGIDAEMEKKREMQSEEALRKFCFSAPAQHELLVKGRKICGSAQARGGGSFLQHGSLLLDFDPVSAFDLISRDKSNRGEKIRKLENSITCVRSEARRQEALDDVCAVIGRAFEKKFGIQLIQGGLTPSEIVLKDKLIAGKYRSDLWNRCGQCEI